MMKKKILVLLPDGVGLRNFAYSDFHSVGVEQGFDICFWNNTPFDLTALGFDEIKIDQAKSHPLTEIYKNARKQIELNQNIKKSGDAVYDTYRFPPSYKNLKNSVKSVATKIVEVLYNSDKGLEKVRSHIKKGERKTSYYQQSLATLKKEQPAMVFCTNQRPMASIAPILASQDLGIPTATFIFSWDNLPKATMVVETDYYFVWSEHMKNELLHYYPYIKANQVFVTGTPQFEAHFEKGYLLSREAFFKQYDLDLEKKYICYSGDDVTTSPDDPQYLEDTANAIRNLNEKGHRLGLLFRRCPVDFSGRYDEVIKKYSDVIVDLPPLWKKIGDGWNTILPIKEDVDLQQNTIAHTELVVNLGSSMVFDYVLHDKPCAYINYDVADKKVADWSVKKIYNYIHFRSMPTKNAVVWLNNPNEIAEKIESVLSDNSAIVEGARKWFEVINGTDARNASKNIWDGIKKIVN